MLTKSLTYIAANGVGEREVGMRKKGQAVLPEGDLPRSVLVSELLSHHQSLEVESMAVN